MLSYLHEFHAGNHADILKHSALFYILNYFNKKDKPYSIFDTHSGSGLYNLDSESSNKTQEAQNGILKLFSEIKNQNSNFTEEFNSFINFLTPFIQKKYYPGSPLIEFLQKRNDSPLFLTELHKTEFAELSKNIQNQKEKTEFKNSKVNVQNISGWDFTKSNIPPQIKRGFLICDPSYEESSDYENAEKFFIQIHKKWSAGTLILWYPLLSYKNEIIQNMKSAISEEIKKINTNTEILTAEFLIQKENAHTETDLKSAIGSKTPRLYGSGLLVINPCWGLDAFLEQNLSKVSKILSSDGEFFIEKI